MQCDHFAYTLSQGGSIVRSRPSTARSFNHAHTRLSLHTPIVERAVHVLSAADPPAANNADDSHRHTTQGSVPGRWYLIASSGVKPWLAAAICSPGLACVSDRAEGPRSGTALVMAEYVGESLSHQEIRAVAAMRHTIAMVSVYSANDYFPLYQAPQPSISPRAALLHAPDASLPVACDRTRRRSTTTTPAAKSRENRHRKTPSKSGTGTCRPLLCFDLSLAP